MPLFLAIAARVCAGDRARLSAVLAGLARYQAMPPALPRPVRPVAAQRGGVCVRDYAGAGRPVLVVPSLINPPTVLDLGEGQSLLAALAGAGLRPLLVDWGGRPEDLGLSGLAARRLGPLLDDLGGKMPVVGYCLGGTLAAALAALAGDRVTRLALLATPWHFSGYGAAARGRLAGWWGQAAALARPLGALPMELLQPAFWSLDEAGLVDKFARVAEIEGAALEGFVRLEDWANNGAPLGLRAAGEMMGAFFGEDLPGRGVWRIGGEMVDVRRISGPVLDVIAGRDRIVPGETALSVGGVGTALRLDSGHVGMIVGRRAPEMLWGPLARWLQEG